jgi:hypothetical protein
MRRDGTHVVRLTNTTEFNEFDDWGPPLAFGADRLQSGRVHSLQEVREGEPST